VTGHDAPYSWVDVNNQRAFERATGFLLQLGHRRIALLNGDEDFDFAHRRREGYLKALREEGGVVAKFTREA
jgi:LacI family transcriptional regulator